RVLRPGGRLIVSDIVLERPLPEAIVDRVEAWVGCVAGSLLRDAYLAAIRDAGFSDVRVVGETDYGKVVDAQTPQVRQIAEVAGLSQQEGADALGRGARIKVSALRRVGAVRWPTDGGWGRLRYRARHAARRARVDDLCSREARDRSRRRPRRAPREASGKLASPPRVRPRRCEPRAHRPDHRLPDRSRRGGSPGGDRRRHERGTATERRRGGSARARGLFQPLRQRTSLRAGAARRDGHAYASGAYSIRDSEPAADFGVRARRSKTAY